MPIEVNRVCLIRMTAHRMFLFLCVSFLVFAAHASAELPELRDLDVSKWDCASKLEGAARTQDGRERNRQKNRSPVELTGLNILSFDTAAFLGRAADYDRQIERKHRRDLSPEQKEKVAGLEQ